MRTPDAFSRQGSAIARMDDLNNLAQQRDILKNQVESHVKGDDKKCGDTVLSRDGVQQLPLYVYVYIPCSGFRFKTQCREASCYRSIKRLAFLSFE